MPRLDKEYKVFNFHSILYGLLCLILLAISFALFGSKDKELAIAFLVCSLAAAFLFFMTPVSFVFSEKKLVIIWLLPIRKTVFWSSVINIVESRAWSSVDNLSKYDITYLVSRNKDTTVKQLELPRNKKTKMLIEKYSKKRIV